MPRSAHMLCCSQTNKLITELQSFHKLQGFLTLLKVYCLFIHQNKTGQKVSVCCFSKMCFFHAFLENLFSPYNIKSSTFNNIFVFGQTKLSQILVTNWCQHILEVFSQLLHIPLTALPLHCLCIKTLLL